MTMRLDENTLGVWYCLTIPHKQDFLLTLRKNLVVQAPMLTLQDTKQILEILLPKKSLTLEDAVKIIEQKHWSRYRSRNSRLKKQRKQLQMSHFR